MTFLFCSTGRETVFLLPPSYFEKADVLCRHCFTGDEHKRLRDALAVLEGARKVKPAAIPSLVYASPHLPLLRRICAFTPLTLNYLQRVGG